MTFWWSVETKILYIPSHLRSLTVKGIDLRIWERFNNDHPADFKGLSLLISDIGAIKQSGVVTYHYCDSYDFKELPKFAEPAPLVPDNFLTSEKVQTPRGIFSFANMTKEQMAAAGYGYHPRSDDGAYHIMGNGTHDFAIRNEDNPLRTAELSTEQNYNQIDSVINNQTTWHSSRKMLKQQA